MFASPMPVPKQQYDGIAGLPLVGGKLYTYAAGTTIPKLTFSDAAGTVPQTNPIVLNARGEPANAIFWSGAYYVELKDALGNLIYTVDNFQPSVNQSELLDDVGAGMVGFDIGTVYSVGTVGRWLVDFATSAGSSLIGFLQAGVGAVLRTMQDKNRDIVNIKDFGASHTKTNAQNRAALDLAIAALNAANGGVIVIDYDICWGVKTRTPSTWPNFTGTTQPILIQDFSRGFTQDPLVYPAAYDGMQYRVWSNTPQTTSPGQHDGNTLFLRGSWNPNVFTSNDANLLGAGLPGRTAFDNYRNGFSTGTNGNATWSFMQGTLAGAGYTNEELSNLQIIKFSMPGDTLGDYSPLVVERKTSWASYGIGTNAPQAQHHFGPATGSPSGYNMMLQSASILVQFVLRGLTGAARDIILRNNDGTFGINVPAVGDAVQVDYTNRRVWIPGSLQLRRQTITYSAAMTFDPALGNFFEITATNGVAFVINQPVLPLLAGLFVTVKIKNTSGGALGAVTWSAIFKMSAWVQPANGFNRAITFECDGTNWNEISRTASDVPN